MPLDREVEPTISSSVAEADVSKEVELATLENIVVVSVQLGSGDSVGVTVGVVAVLQLFLPLNFQQRSLLYSSARAVPAQLDPIRRNSAMFRFVIVQRVNSMSWKHFAFCLVTVHLGREQPSQEANYTTKSDRGASDKTLPDEPQAIKDTTSHRIDRPTACLLLNYTHLFLT